MDAFGLAHGRQEQELSHPFAPHFRVPTDQEILQHGGFLEQLDVLEGPGNAEIDDLVRFQREQLLAFEPDTAAVGRMNPADGIENGTLTGAVGPMMAQTSPGSM